MTSKTPSADQLQILIDAGLELIPLHQWDAISKSNKPVGKAPVGRWRIAHAMTLDQATEHMATGGNIGIRVPPWLLIVDDDPRNYLPDDDPVERLEAEYELPLDKTAQTVTGSGGYHIFFRLPDDVAEAIAKGDMRVVNELPNFQGVEFKGHGRQVVAPGSIHPDTQERYVLDNDTVKLEVMDIVDAPPKLVEAVVRDANKRSVIPGAQLYTTGQLQATLVQLDPTEFRDHDKWLKFMMACHAATQGEGLDEFVTWSTGDPEFAHHGSSIAYRWDTLDADKAQGISHLTFRKVVEDHGGTVPADREAYAEIDADEDTDLKSPKPWLQQLNDEWTLIATNGQVRAYREEKQLLGDQEQIIVADYPVAAFEKLLSNRKVEGKPLGKTWVEWIHRNECAGIVFMPDTAERFPEVNGTRYFNLWRGFAVEPNGSASCDMLYQLIRETLADGDQKVADYVINWLAYAVQYPGDPAEVAVVFRGGKGTGKGTLGRAFFNLFGTHGMQITSPTLLTGRFNSHLRNTVALFADEAFYAGDKTGESVLKGLLTEPYLMFEGKGTNAFMGQNCLHVMMASNQDWVVPAGTDGERRFAVFQVSDNRKGDVAFFDKLNHQLYRQGGLGRLLHDLQTRDITGWHPRENYPRTVALAEQSARKPEHALEWRFTRALMTGDLAELGGFIKDDRAIIHKEALREHCDPVQCSKQAGFQLSMSPAPQIPAKFLKDAFGLKGKGLTMQLTLSGDELFSLGLAKHRPGQQRCFVLPPLKECRRRYVQHRLGLDDPATWYGDDWEEADWD